MIKINEMAYDRSDAIDKCSRLGTQFVSHFSKVIESGINDIDFHHCTEIQAFLDEIRKVTLKQNNNKKLSNVQLMDWFFTVGSSPEVLFDTDIECDIYNELIIKLLYDKQSKVEDIMKELIDI